MSERKDGWPSIAVIIPNHTRTQELAEAVESVQRQSYPGHVSIYVVYEPRAEINPLLENLRDGVVWIPHPARSTSSSIAARRNVGLQASHEDLVAFLDDDDIWHPDKLRRQMVALRENRAIACATGYVGFRGEGRPEWTDGPVGDPKTLSHYQVLRSGLFMTSSALVLGRVAREVKLDERPEWLGLDDYDFKLKLVARGPIALVPEVLTGLRTEATSGSRARPALHFARALDVFIDHFAKNRRSPAAWRAFPIRLGVTALFPGHDRDEEAVAMLRRALNGRILGRAERPVVAAIEAMWRSQRIAPALRKLLPRRLLT